MEKKIVLIGGRGVVGSNLLKYLKIKFKKINVCERKNRFEEFLDDTNIIVHAANSSKKYEALKNPEKDYSESIKKTLKISSIFKNNKIILISSISARIEKSIYGINRKKCEEIILNTNKNNLVFRLPVIYSNSHKRGILYDLLHSNRIYMDKETLINPIIIDQFSEFFINNLNLKGLHEYGSNNNIEINSIVKAINSKSIIKGKKIDLTSLKTLRDLPDIGIFLERFIKINSCLKKS